MKKRTLLWLVLALVIFGGGAWMVQETNLFGGVFLSPRAKQLAYLKEHQKEIEDFVEETGTSNMQMQEINSENVNLWMTRFNKWYSAIDRVSQNVKAKFVQMKSEIVKAIKNKIQERENRQKIEQQNKEVEEESR